MDEFVFRAEDAMAVGFPIGRKPEFVVRAGSTALVRAFGADRNGQLPERVETLIAQGVLHEHPVRTNLLVFGRDHHFSSATAAGDVVNGANVSAPSKWIHTKTGVSLKEWLASA